MSGLLSIDVQEARGFVAVPADLDSLAVVIGCSSLGSGLSSFFLSGKAAADALGYGDAVDVLTQVIEQKQDSGSAPKKPAAFITTPITTVATYGAIDSSGKTGTSVVTAGAAVPRGTYEARLKWINGGTVGVVGMLIQWSLDGGRTWSNTVALGTAVSYTIPGGNVQFAFAAGTFVTGDQVAVRTVGPKPSTTDVATAFATLAASTVDCAVVVLGFPCDAAMAAIVSSGLTALGAVGKRCVAIIPARMRNFESAETEAAWLAAVSADFANFTDSRVHVRTAYGIQTDAMTTRQYLRNDIAQFAADVVRVPRFTWPCAPADRPVPNYSLVDATGATVGHDEGPRGATNGLSNETLGNRFGCNQRLPNPNRREDVFNTVPWVMYASDERVRNLMVRRLANAMERVAVEAGTPQLGAGPTFYTPTGPGSGLLTATARNAIHGAIYQALKAEFKNEIDNAEDAAVDSGLVQVDPAVTVSGGNLLGVSVTLAPIVGGFVLSLSLTLAVIQ